MGILGTLDIMGFSSTAKYCDINCLERHAKDLNSEISWSQDTRSQVDDKCVYCDKALT